MHFGRKMHVLIIQKYSKSLMCFNFIEVYMSFTKIFTPKFSRSTIAILCSSVRHNKWPASDKHWIIREWQLWPHAHMYNVTDVMKLLAWPLIWHTCTQTEIL